jgi:hypothetical protein
MAGLGPEPVLSGFTVPSPITNLIDLSLGFVKSHIILTPKHWHSPDLFQKAFSNGRFQTYKKVTSMGNEPPLPPSSAITSILPYFYPSLLFLFSYSTLKKFLTLCVILP